MKRATLIVYYFVFVLYSFTTGVALAGCTSVRHEPRCECDCKSNNSHFECGGIHSYQKVEGR
jgi:hypothetical protein